MTTTPSGVGSYVAIAPETTFGTYVAPTRTLEFESESIEWKPNRTKGKSLANGNLFTRRAQRHTTTATVEGDVVTPFYSHGMGYWLGLVFGTMNITPVVISGSAYSQTHVLGDNLGQSGTIQVGRPTMDGTSHPYSYTGVKCVKAVFEQKLDEPLRLTISVDGKDVTEAQTAITPTYTAGNAPLFFDQSSFTMAATVGSEAIVEGVRDFTLTITRSLRTDGFYMDATGRKSAQVTNNLIDVQGQITTDFLSKASFADVFYSDTPQSIVVNWQGALISGSNYYGLKLSLPSCNFDSEPPKVGGPDIIQPSMAFTVNNDDTHAPVTALYTSTDTTL